MVGMSMAWVGYIRTVAVLCFVMASGFVRLVIMAFQALLQNSERDASEGRLRDSQFARLVGMSSLGRRLQ